ncbi:MFS transporter [Parabacteroides sp.]
MNTQKTNPLGPFIVLIFIYFIVGFLTTVNGQCQAPLKVAFLKDAGEFKNTFVTLISFFFFLGYLLNGTLGGRWINRYGYKKTLIRALSIMVVGLTVFFFSSWFTVRYESWNLAIASARVPYGYFIFLLGSYLMGTSATLLQVVINPYVAAYEVRGTQPVQRMNIVCAFNSFGTTIAPFFVTGVMFGGVAIEEIQVEQLMVPFVLLAAFIALTAFITQRLYLPDVMNTKANEGERLERSIWSFRHLRLGVIAIFFYVGAEVSIGVNINLHAVELEGPNGMHMNTPALLATLYWGGLMVGRIVSSMFSKISPRVQLTVATSFATVLTVIAIWTNNLWVLVSVGLFHSVMWGCIFTLAIQGLNKYTSKASGVFMMGVFGGAVFPVLQGALADVLGSWRWTWGIVVVCELVMLYYAQVGSRIKEERRMCQIE